MAFHRNIVDILRQARVYPAESEQRLADDVASAMRECPTIRPRLGTLTRNDGSKQALLSLTGTVPIYYRGNAYNIPVEIWITEFHPHIAPLVFVTPTRNMQVRKNHRHVEPSGKVHHPFLTEWDAGRSSLSGLLGVLASAFSAEPPVYACAAPAADPEARERRGLLEQARRKTREEMVQLRDGAQAEYSKLVAEKQSLRSSQSTIEEGLSGLTLQQSTAEAAIRRLAEDEQELDEWLRDNGHLAEEVEIDAIMQESDRPRRQILENLAEDLAIQDTLYVLDEAVENGVIDFATFMRETRRLAREQFFKRALLRKIKLSQAAEERTRSAR